MILVLERWSCYRHHASMFKDLAAKYTQTRCILDILLPDTLPSIFFFLGWSSHADTSCQGCFVQGLMPVYGELWVFITRHGYEFLRSEPPVGPSHNQSGPLVLRKAQELFTADAVSYIVEIHQIWIPYSHPGRARYILACSQPEIRYYRWYLVGYCGVLWSSFDRIISGGILQLCAYLCGSGSKKQSSLDFHGRETRYLYWMAGQ